MEIDLSEARNLEGNAAFAAGDYAKAAAAYVEAVKANGKVAKYRTNLANTLLELGRTSEALEEAAAAVAVDPTWPKGFLFKAVAHEHLGNVQQALVVCEEGLKIHRHHPSLEEASKRLHKLKHQLDRQERQVLARGLQAVRYNAKVVDMAGHHQEFSFVHKLDKQRVQKAVADRDEEVRILEEVTMPHYREMLQAKPWKCVCCGQPATKLFLHPMSYLHKPEPFVQDLGTSPGCSSQHCATEVTQGVRQIMAEVTDEAG